MPTKLISKLLSISLKKKVILGYVLMSLFIVVLFGMMVKNTLNVKSNLMSMTEKSKKIGSAMMLKTDINGMRAAFLRMTIYKDEETWDNQEAVIERLSENVLKYINDIKPFASEEKIRRVETNLIPFIETIKKELIPLVRKGRNDEAIRLLSTVQAERSRKFLSSIDEIIKDLEEQNALSIEDVDRQSKQTINRTVITSVVVFVITCMVSFGFINKYVLNTLKNISEAANSVAKGDLTVSIAMQIKDDFGRLAEDVNSIIKSIQIAMRDIAHKTYVILNDLTTMSFSSQEVCYRVDVDLQRTTAAATSTEEMSSTTSEISKNIQSLANSSESAKRASLQGKEMIEKTIASISDVNEQINQSSQKIVELASYSKKIDDIVLLIKDIADQTNLLALNAAIEAARAGEQGRGFAVVADEVRKLAQRTANATVEINNILSSINRETAEATDLMESAVEKAQYTSEVANDLSKTFEHIFEGFNQVSDMAQLIVTAAEQQTATAHDIAQKLASIAEDSKESSANIKTMAMSFSKFTENAKSFLKTINNFKDPIIRIGVLKADYILWLNRALQMIDLDDRTFSDEFNPQNSRMGKWYHGEGSILYKTKPQFVELQKRHQEFHTKGRLMVEAGWKKDRDSVKRHLQDCVKLTEEIFKLLDELVA